MPRDGHAAVTRESRVSHGTLSSPLPARPGPARPVNNRGYVCMHRRLPNARVRVDVMRGATR